MNKQEKIETLLGTGMTVKAIAKEVKCTRDYVYQVRGRRNKEKQEVKRVAREDVKPVVQQVTTVTPNDIQVGGSHYKEQDIQPWDAIHAWGLGFLGGNVVKYMARHAQKGGIEDLRKARHYLDKMIETMTKVG
jgi:hypothetical protein